MNSRPLWTEMLRWSALTAAFIGPGTVTTAAKAGASSGYALVWVVFASIAATVLVQWMVAKLTQETGKPLLDLLAQLPGGKWLSPCIVLLLAFGCAAFQAGNLSGAAAGIRIAGSGISKEILISVLGIAALALVLSESRELLRFVLGGFVAFMSVFFIGTALFSVPDYAAALSGMAPSIPVGDQLSLALGLFGTTLVPYNIFMGSALAKHARKEHLGAILSFTIGVGGLITLSILVCGTFIEGPFSLPAMASELEFRTGPAGRIAFAAGLFAAGFSSALTAPYAAGLLFKSTSGKRIIISLVVLAGVLAGTFGGTPAEVILAAQTANALLLPAVLGALFLLGKKHFSRKAPTFAILGMAVFFLLLAVRWVFGLLS